MHTNHTTTSDLKTITMFVLTRSGYIDGNKDDENHGNFTDPPMYFATFEGAQKEMFARVMTLIDNLYTMYEEERLHIRLAHDVATVSNRETGDSYRFDISEDIMYV